MSIQEYPAKDHPVEECDKKHTDIISFTHSGDGGNCPRVQATLP